MRAENEHNWPSALLLSVGGRIRRRENNPASGLRGKVPTYHRRRPTGNAQLDERNSNDDRQATALPGHRDPIPRVSLPATQNARRSAGSAPTNECRGAGGVYFARLHVAASQGAAEASQSGSDGPNDRTC